MLSIACKVRSDKISGNFSVDASSTSKTPVLRPADLSSFSNLGSSIESDRQSLKTGIKIISPISDGWLTLMQVTDLDGGYELLLPTRSNVSEVRWWSSPTSVFNPANYQHGQDIP